MSIDTSSETKLTCDRSRGPKDGCHGAAQPTDPKARNRAGLFNAGVSVDARGGKMRS